MYLAGNWYGANSFAPYVDYFEVVLPAVRSFMPSSRTANLKYTTDYAQDEKLGACVLEIDPPLDIDFRKHLENTGALLTPKFDANRIHRELGPVPSRALEAITPASFREIYQDATLLGLSLADIIKIDDASQPPTIVPVLNPSGSPVDEWLGKSRSRPSPASDNP
jgi:hypothetical protein